MRATVGVTVLFTDLVGSTALSASMSASDADAVRLTHFRLLRDAVKANGGHEVKNLGDGIMAVFPGASAALAAATAMQQSIDHHNRLDDGPRLAIRVGVATGDCTQEAGDFFGEPVVQAARLCAACEGGQILVTSVVGLLAPRDAYDLEPVGALDLKGLPEPVPTLRLSWTAGTGAGEALAPLPPRLGTQTGLSPLVGRVAERDLLRDALKEAASGRRRIVLVTGEAGLGKTRLTAAFATETFELGATVLYGRCDEELAVPYLPWVESLTHLVDHLEDDAVAALDPGIRSQLGRLLPSLHARGRFGDDVGDEPASADQYALFGAVTGLLGEVTAERTLLIVLDDLHWADRGTLQLLRHVATSLPEARLLVVATYRETDLGTDDPLTETSARLHREPGVHRIALSGLSDVEVVELLAGAAGHDLDDVGVSLAHTLRADTAGNPFFIVEVVRHLVETGTVSQRDGRWVVTTDLADIELPQSVRDVVGQRIRRLAPEARTLLTAGAVVGREFDTAVVAAATDLDEDQVLDLLEAAMAAGLVAEVAGAVDRFGFTHALVQHTLYAELSESRRARMHRRVATCIEELADGEPGELALHWFAAVRPAELERAVVYAVEAGNRALDSAAPDEAVRWYTLAFEALDDAQPELRCEVQVRLGDAERQAGRDVYRERLLDAADHAQRLGRGDLLIQAALANNRGWHSASGEVDEERVAVLEAALRCPEGEAEAAARARLLATLAAELTYTDDPRRFDLANEAAELGRSLGDAAVLLDALERVAGAINVPEMLPERQRRAAEMMELTAGRSDPLRRFLALEHQIDVHLATANMVELRRCAEERRAIAQQLGQPTFIWLVANNEALLDLIEGDVDAAAAGAEAAFELGIEAGQPDVMVYFSSLLGQIHMHRNQYAEIIPLVRERVEATPGISGFKAVLVYFLAQDGEIDEAAEMIAGMAADGFSFNHDIVWLTSTALSAETAAIVGDLGSAALLSDRLQPFADQVINTRAHCIGPVSSYLGAAATALGRRDAATAYFRTAIRLSDGLRSPFYRARAMLGLAEALGDAGGAERVALIADAAELADRFAMPGLAARADTLAVS